MNTLLSRYSNKEVSFRFAGTDLSFFLSQALFSSYEIDRGSRLLLKTLDQQVDFEQIRTVLDIGCGVGTLGVSMQKRFPHLQVIMQDRDALAVAFARLNAEHNGIERAWAVGGLAFQGLEQKAFDLTVANIPAKVGEPVLKDIFSSMLQHSLLAAAVVVRPLGEFTERSLLEMGAEVTCREAGPGHMVFHFRAERDTPAGLPPGASPSAPRAEDLPAAYFRGSQHFQCGEVAYSLDTVWGLADFDTVPFQTRAAVKSLSAVQTPRRVCIWNPGQGHTSTLLAALFGGRMTADSPPSELQIDLLGRDILALQNSRHNLLGRQELRAGQLLHCPGPAEAAFRLKEEQPAAVPDLFLVELEHLTGVPSAQEVVEAAAVLLKSGGTLLITGKSAHHAHFERSPEGFRAVTDKKHKGYKSVVLKRV